MPRQLPNLILAAALGEEDDRVEEVAERDATVPLLVHHLEHLPHEHVVGLHAESAGELGPRQADGHHARAHLLQVQNKHIIKKHIVKNTSSNILSKIHNQKNRSSKNTLSKIHDQKTHHQKHIIKNTLSKTHHQKHIIKNTSLKTHPSKTRQQKHIIKIISSKIHNQTHIIKNTSSKWHHQKIHYKKQIIKNT